MTSAVQDLYKKASGLSAEERAALAALLLESLEGAPDAGVEDAWAEEIEQRMADYRAGRIKTIPWPEVRARLLAEAATQVNGIIIGRPTHCCSRQAARVCCSESP